MWKIEPLKIYTFKLHCNFCADIDDNSAGVAVALKQLRRNTTPTNQLGKWIAPEHTFYSAPILCCLLTNLSAALWFGHGKPNPHIRIGSSVRHVGVYFAVHVSEKLWKWVFFVISINRIGRTPPITNAALWLYTKIHLCVRLSLLCAPTLRDLCFEESLSVL